MAKTPAFTLVYSAELKPHLRAIEPKYHTLIASEIEAHLRFDADVEARNRKPLQRPIGFGAEWELRLGPANRFRVFYRVDAERREVRILAIGVKDRNKIVIGGEEVGG